MVVRPYGVSCLFAEVIGEYGCAVTCKQELSPGEGFPEPSTYVSLPPGGRWHTAVPMYNFIFLWRCDGRSPREF